MHAHTWGNDGGGGGGGGAELKINKDLDWILSVSGLDNYTRGPMASCYLGRGQEELYIHQNLHLMKQAHKKTQLL